MTVFRAVRVLVPVVCLVLEAAFLLMLAFWVLAYPDGIGPGDPETDEVISLWVALTFLWLHAMASTVTAFALLSRWVMLRWPGTITGLAIGLLHVVYGSWLSWALSQSFGPHEVTVVLPFIGLSLWIAWAALSLVRPSRWTMSQVPE
jgi:hypothetical protein